MMVSQNASLIKPGNLNDQSVNGFFSTRSIHSVDSVAKIAGVSRDIVYLPLQKHTNRIHILGSDLEPVVSDAVLTDRKRILIGVQVADCVPVLLYDAGKKIVGAVHAGWRGTAQLILKRAIKTMKDVFSSFAKDMRIAVGPGIRGCCYCVGDDVRKEIIRNNNYADCYHVRNGKHFIDLSTVNVNQAISCGVDKKNIWQSEECTFCSPDRFYSYRYSGGPTGRQGGYIIMW
jgi:YfiH family protein